MAVSTISSVLPLPPMSNSTMSSKPKQLAFSMPQNVLKLQVLRSKDSFRSFAVPELLESEEALELPPPEATEGPDTYAVEGSITPGSSTLAIGSDVDKMAPKQKIRIKLRSYFVNLIEDSCKQIMDAARTTNAKTMGPVPLPTKKRIYCVLKSPHVHKDARFHFEIRTHQRLIDIIYPTAQTIDSLMQLDLPAGVDVEVKL
ncbi:30S ribosomal protein S10 [Macadamia integrifolia]|uniref:30S ribosomal protein S10 n=1 Tax=Macadamia integrifolia TaxID=60698 RepID=UPI001C4EAC31|nr:30S ribosomal protein S10 [Macadamia integrifolia]